ncbi:MAG: NADH-quinone oxidoreductase subunit M [Bdellovibrionaceae bacterium]|nr:NADH-quinone oxidoreductase subunit M [Pseudobdellovibrionaceae bacterium]
MGLLSLLIFLPLITAVFVVAAPKQSQVRWIALIGTGLHLGLTALATFKYLTEALPGTSSSDLLTKLFLVEKFDWFSSLGIQYLLGVDGISMAMVILTSIIIFTGVLASWNVENRVKEFFALLLVLVTGVFGVFLSFDLFLFFMFYEVAVLPMYLLIGVWGTGPKEYSAMKLTLMLMIGSAFILVGILALYYTAGAGTGHFSFDLNQLAQFKFPPFVQTWVFPVIFVGFGILGALYPFHTWSPDGHASAPTAVSMLHAGVLMKLGGYGALRVAVYLLPEGAKEWGLFFMALTTINILYGAFGAIKQKDLKFFTAYSSVSHCGVVLFGVATLNLMGFKGAILQMFSHGIMTGLFFALIGMVYGRTHTRQIPEMGGLAKVMPWLSVCFYIAGLASLGLPGFSGFIAEAHVFMGGFFGNPWSAALPGRIMTILAAMSIVVTAVYVLRGLGKVFLGPLQDTHHAHLTDATFTEKLTTGILISTMAVVGIYPQWLIELIGTSIYPILNRLH